MTKNRAARQPKLTYQADPIRESLSVLGAKWSLLIIRDVAFLDLHRFGEIRKNNPGLTAHVLSRRLRQLVIAGLLDRAQQERNILYNLTSKGEDAVYILLAVLRYGNRHYMKKGQDSGEEEAMKLVRYRLPLEGCCGT